MAYGEYSTSWSSLAGTLENAIPCLPRRVIASGTGSTMSPGGSRAHVSCGRGRGDFYGVRGVPHVLVRLWHVCAAIAGAEVLAHLHRRAGQLLRRAQDFIARYHDAAKNVQDAAHLPTFAPTPSHATWPEI